MAKCAIAVNTSIFISLKKNVKPAGFFLVSPARGFVTPSTYNAKRCCATFLRKPGLDKHECPSGQIGQINRYSKTIPPYLSLSVF